MDKFSILSIPAYMQKKYLKNLLGVQYDYMRFNIKNRKLFWQIIPRFEFSLDLDNSNVAYIWDVCCERVYSSRGVAYKFAQAINYPWEHSTAKPVPFMFVEIYDQWQSLRGSIGRVDFYGAYFHFEDWIQEDFRKCFTELQALANKHDNIDVRRTRCDIAVDIAYEFPQNHGKWIVPSGNSRRSVSCYKTEWLWNSYGYLSKKNTGYGVRMYNKKVDITAKKKEGWYWNLDDSRDWTRIEFEFYPPYSSDLDEQNLFDAVKECVLWTKEVYNLGLKYRKSEGISIESAYRYFEGYAERHMVSMDYLIDEILNFHLQKSENQ